MEFTNTYPEPEPLKPWNSIWTQPSKTMRYLLWTGNYRYAELLFFLAGMAHGLEEASSSSSLEGDSLLFIIFIVPLIGGVGGLISYHILAWLLHILGRALGGKGKYKQVKSALAWAFAPAIVSLATYAFGIALFGGELFSEFTPRMDASQFLSGMYLGFVFIQFVAAIWTIFIGINTLSVAHGYSRWSAFFTYVLSIIVIVLVAVVIGLFLALLFGLAR